VTAPPDSRIVVACAADEAFAMPLAVLVRSILDYLPQSRRFAMHIVDMGISPETKARLARSWPADQHDLHWLAVDPKALSHLPVWGRMNIATYQRLLMGQVLPTETNRVIWLDCDAMVLADLDCLWATPLEGKTIAAAQDLVVPYFSSRFGVERFRELGLPPDSPHFNAGVMLVDLDAWRSAGVAEQAFEYLSRHAQEVWFWDQEALNVVLAGKWKLVDPRWNQIASVAGRWFFRPEHLNDEMYQKTVDSPWLIHWAGTIKPWKFRSRRPAHLKWYELLDRTDWRGWRAPRTMLSVALSIYDAWARNLLYPIEPFLLEAQRRLSR
jgi:lipopolysaccharide biosynthesis glycosyltransferase